MRSCYIYPEQKVSSPKELVFKNKWFVCVREKVSETACACVSR